MKIGPVIKPEKGHNRWCGPAALSIIAGIDTGHAAGILKLVSGKRSIMGTASFDMAKGLRMLGYSMRMHGVYVHAGRKTLTQWLEATKATRGGKVWLIAAGGHWLVVQGFQYACGITGQIVGLKDAPHRRARVDEVYEITQVGPAKDFSPPPKAKADPAKAKAKRLAKLHGVEIERHTDLDSKPWYVSHPSFEDSEADPYAGDHYARSWPEILERVETYIEALK